MVLRLWWKLVKLAGHGTICDACSVVLYAVLQCTGHLQYIKCREVRDAAQIRYEELAQRLLVVLCGDQMLEMLNE